MKGECKCAKVKNKHWGMMMRGEWKCWQAVHKGVICMVGSSAVTMAGNDGSPQPWMEMSGQQQKRLGSEVKSAFPWLRVTCCKLPINLDPWETDLSDPFPTAPSWSTDRLVDRLGPAQDSISILCLSQGCPQVYPQMIRNLGHLQMRYVGL